MRYLRYFFGSVFSARMYRQLRDERSGYGVDYSAFLFLVFIAIGVSGAFVHAGDVASTLPRSLYEIEQLLGVIAISAILRLLMLLALAVAGRLYALTRKETMAWAASFRVAGVAYTPVVVLDTVAFCIHGGMTLHPAMLFAMGVVMLLAALRATR